MPPETLDDGQKQIVPGDAARVPGTYSMKPMIPDRARIWQPLLPAPHVCEEPHSLRCYRRRTSRGRSEAPLASLFSILRWFLQIAPSDRQSTVSATQQRVGRRALSHLVFLRLGVLAPAVPDCLQMSLVGKHDTTRMLRTRPPSLDKPVVQNNKHDRPFAE